MKRLAFLISPLLVTAFVFNAVMACGPAYVSPVFRYEHAPENPFENFAAGKIGIVRPTQRRLVLIAAYRYLNGGAFSQPEQQALVEVWNAEFNNVPFEKDDAVTEAVKKWVAARKSVLGTDAKVPSIYVEREYGGYDFFPNCTKSSFETAAATLSSRATSYGSEDAGVRNWLAAQDKVFENCASGRSDPGAPDDAMPEWLRKDRAYQKAAADFYALDYSSARKQFEAIAQDGASPWRETADYLVGRTLVREASLARDKSLASVLYSQAEQNASRIASGGGRFADAAAKLISLVKYRTRPQERVRELAQNIAFVGGETFRQDLVDYGWLMDKFEKETLEAEEKKKVAANPEAEPTPVPQPEEKKDEKAEAAIRGELMTIMLFLEDGTSRTFYAPPDASEDDAITHFETELGRKLNEKERAQVVENRRSEYASLFAKRSSSDSGYEGGYWGVEKMSPASLPDFLRMDELTNWLFAFQAQGDDAYAYAFDRWRESRSQLWLATAISKATKSSPEVARLLEAAEKMDRRETAYPMVAFHMARIMIDQGRTAQARKLIDDILSSTVEMPVSSRNDFMTARAGLAESLDDYVKYSLLTPFAYDFDGKAGTIADLIAEQKSWYNPESYPDQTREQYDKEVEDRWAPELKWEGKPLFDTSTIMAINQHFPLQLLAATEQTPSLPDYMRERFATAIWTRAALLGDFAAAARMKPALLRYHPELEEIIAPIDAASTPAAKKRAAIWAIMKNPMLTPYVEDSFGRTDNEFGTFDANDWWCGPYYDDSGDKAEIGEIAPRPTFVTPALASAAKAEKQKLDTIGDAPKYLGEYALEWARLAPADKRVPEALFITWQANGWTKYGCGNNEELRDQIGRLLKRRYAQSEWTSKMEETLKSEQ